MHFFNPADRMKLIEVIAGVNTPVETVEAIKKISTEIGKSPVQVNEAAGFVVNRILIPMINEAAFIKMEGVSDIAGIDTAMSWVPTTRWAPWSWVTLMVRGGNLGCKTGKGFYVYNADRTKTPVDAL